MEIGYKTQHGLPQNVLIFSIGNSRSSSSKVKKGKIITSGLIILECHFRSLFFFSHAWKKVDAFKTSKIIIKNFLVIGFISDIGEGRGCDQKEIAVLPGSFDCQLLLLLCEARSF